jgi:hypothetical protein
LEARITRYLAITSADIEEFPPQVIFFLLPFRSLSGFFGPINNFLHWGQQSFLEYNLRKTRNIFTVLKNATECSSYRVFTFEYMAENCVPQLLKFIAANFPPLFEIM